MAKADHHHDHDHDHDHAHDHDHDHDHDTDKAMEPAVTVEDAGPARKKLRIEFTGDQIAAKLEENFQSLQQDAVIPGFRRGRAPKRLLERKFGGDIRKEVASQLVGAGYQFAVDKHELRVLGEPEIKDAENVKLPDAGSLTVEMEVEVVPEFKLPELKGIEVDKPVIEINDDRVEAEFNRFREMYGQLKPADAAAGGDYITGDIQVRSESGEVLHEQSGAQVFVPGESRGYKGVLAGIIVEDLGKKLEGKKAGEAVTLELTGPSNHEVEKLRDQKLTVELNTTRIDRMEPLPADELVKMTGFEGEAELRKQLRERLEGQSKAEQSRAMGNQVIDALLSKVELELPTNLSARQSARVLERRAMDLFYRGATREDVEQQLAELRAASEEQAQRELKTLFIMDAVARELSVEVSEAEVNGRIVQLAFQNGRRPERMREEMARNGQLDSLFVQLREEKAVGKILEDAKVNEVSLEDFNKKHGNEAEEGKKKPARKPSKKAEPAADADEKAEAKPRKSGKKKSEE